MNLDWKRKLTSRKLWIAIAGFVSGLILAFGGSESQATTIAGVILQGASVIGYLHGEGLADMGNKNTNTWAYYPVTMDEAESETDTYD